MAKKKVKYSKELMLDELISIVREYNESLIPVEDEEGNKSYPKTNVKTADKIASIKTICQLMGYFEPVKTETTNKTITLQF